VVVATRGDDNRTGIIIDNGTGVVNVVEEFQRYAIGHVLILQTHYHLDHMSGLPQNPYLFKVANWQNVGMYGPKLYRPCNDAVTGILQTHIHPANIDSRVRIRDLDEFNPKDWIGVTNLTHIKIPHPGGCVAYRLELCDGNRSIHIVIATDCELVTQEHTDRLSTFSQGCNLLVLDCQWFDDHYTACHGHNSITIVSGLIRQTKDLDQIYLTHFDPRYSRYQIGEMTQAVRKATNRSVHSAFDRHIIGL
jgi:ribonuclease BN (tRNA processing enzyme)